MTINLPKGQFLCSIQNKETEAIPEFNTIPAMSSKASNNDLKTFQLLKVLSSAHTAPGFCLTGGIPWKRRPPGPQTPAAGSSTQEPGVTEEVPAACVRGLFHSRAGESTQVRSSSSAHPLVTAGHCRALPGVYNRKGGYSRTSPQPLWMGADRPLSCGLLQGDNQRSPRDPHGVLSANEETVPSTWREEVLKATCNGASRR